MNYFFRDLAESEYCSDVVVVLLDLLPEAHGLVVLGRVDVLGPPALHVVHTLRQELRALSVHLQYVQIGGHLVRCLRLSSPYCMLLGFGFGFMMLSYALLK